MLTISGSASNGLAKEISENLNSQFVEPEKDKFPDGEIYLRIPKEIEGEDVLIIQSTPSPTNDNYIELFLILDTVKDLGAEKVTAVVPYLSHWKSSPKNETNDKISPETVAKLLDSAGADELYTIDLNQEASNKISENFEKSFQNLTATETLTEHINEKYSPKNPLILGIEKNRWIKKLRENIGENSELRYIENGEIGVEEEDIENRTIIIGNRIISSGENITEIVESLKEKEAKNIWIVSTHSRLPEEILENLRGFQAKIISTNTIEGKWEKVSISKTIAEAISQ